MKSAVPTPRKGKIRLDWGPVQFTKISLDWDEVSPLESLAKVHVNWHEESSDLPTGAWDIPLTSSYFQHLGAINTEQKRFQELSFPLAGSYPSPLPTVFLHQVPRLSALNRDPLLIARDGALPLLLFFEKFKRPLGLKSKIAIHEDLLDWIPAAWKTHVASYRLFSHPIEKPRKSVFIYGTNSAAMISPVSIKQALERNSETLQASNKIYLSLPSHFFAESEPIQGHAENARLIFSEIGTNTEICDWGSFLPKEIVDSSYAISLNKDSLIADTWLAHALRQSGADCLDRPLTPDETIFRCSHQHGFAVCLKPRFPKVLETKLRTRRAELLASFESTVFDWKEIFTGTKKRESSRGRRS